MVEIRVTKDMPVEGMKLRDISSRFSPSVLIVAVLRKDTAIIPKGDFRIRADDTIYVVGQPSSISSFFRHNKLSDQRVKNVMIVGGGRIAYYLAKFLEETGIRAKIIEVDRDRCITLSELLPHTLIINGDGSDETILDSENLSEMGAFVSLTGHDEENFMTALLARQAGVQKVIAKISRTNYLGLIKKLGIDSIINPSLITTNMILQYVRGMKNALGNTIETLYKIVGDQVEAIEFTANETTSFLDIPLRDLEIVDDVLIAVIVRKNDIIIPHGNDMVMLGDSVVLIAKNKQINDLNDIIISGGKPVEH